MRIVQRRRTNPDATTRLGVASLRELTLRKDRKDGGEAAECSPAQSGLKVSEVVEISALSGGASRPVAT